MSALTKENYGYDYRKEFQNETVQKRVIKKKRKNKLSIGIVKNVSFVIATFVFGLTIIYNYALITERKMDINELDNEIETLNNKIDGYNVSLESLKNTNMIEDMAKSYLGMNYPTRKQTVFLDVNYTEQGELATISDGDEINVGLLERAFKLFQ